MARPALHLERDDRIEGGITEFVRPAGWLDLGGTVIYSDNPDQWRAIAECAAGVATRLDDAHRKASSEAA